MLLDCMSLMGRAGESPPPSSFEARALARVDRALGRALLSSVTRYAALHARGSRALDGGRRFIEGFAARALTLDERASLGRTLYGRRSTTDRGALFPWEDAWYRAALPAAPREGAAGRMRCRERSCRAARSRLHRARFGAGNRALRERGSALGRPRARLAARLRGVGRG